MEGTYLMSFFIGALISTGVLFLLVNWLVSKLVLDKRKSSVISFFLVLTFSLSLAYMNLGHSTEVLMYVPACFVWLIYGLSKAKDYSVAENLEI